MRPLPPLSSATSRFLSLLSNCSSATHINQIQAQLILLNLHSNTTIASHFISACQSLGLLDLAHLHFLTQLPKPHVFICNSLIRAFSHSHTPRNQIHNHIPLSIYIHMHKSSILPNNFTFPFLLKSLADSHDFKQGQCLHTHVLKLGHLYDIYVQNSLLNVYASCGRMEFCRQVFDEMPQRDVVSWTVLIMGYRNSENYDDALISFEQMQYAGVVPNHVTMVNALAACANFGALEMGVWIHDFIRRSDWELDVILGTSLIDMYGKCGRIEEGLAVFNSMKEKNTFSWNALIKGLALAKNGKETVGWFKRMEQEGIRVDEVTLVSVLNACSHSGLVDIGRQIFRSLSDGKYGFLPGVKHYACMIDLLARSGYLEDALKCLREMPYEPTKAIWGSLLAGGKTHGNLELSEFAARKLVELEPGNSTYYVLLSNIYAEMGRWNDVEKVRGMMKQKDLKKDLGSSSVEFEPSDQVTQLLAQ
ncbi:PREDICTED: pentatricopeptide repeat-containing protein At5g43790-like [Prunus mume]|uniref:Pentatricopeptide repeat-containing protein At5g43790-like n=1 Tax=Prunus mume TaxID=102107 RepID=A0ABM0P6F3_PRUMU|nr:PREDICTED: pentatricopeptide repeat-containing protein At5g43790-like [Prunus mume]